MVLTDQQLRQELVSLGETVPPITQRNREQLRARLELLQSLKSVRGTAHSPSKSRSRVTASPSKLNTTSSPSRTRATASPSKSRGAAASPARSTLTNSPSRTRGNASTGSGRATRSKHTPNLIELSDSEAESTATGASTSRSGRAGQTASQAQTRSIALRNRTNSSTKSNTSPIGRGAATDDVEQSIARHRREIKQLLDSARDRNRTTGSGSPSRSGRQSPPSSPSKARTRRSSSKSESEETQSKSPSKGGKQFAGLKKNISKPIQSLWKKFSGALKKLLKLLLIGSLAIAGLVFLYQKGDSLFPRQEEITCSVANATRCEDMRPVIAAVRKQLQVRAGEVDCNFRPKADILVNRTEVERYLNERGLKFRGGDNVRWNALLTYIIDTPIQDIILWNATNQETKHIPEVKKLSTTEARRSLTCQVRQDVSKNTLRNLLLLILGSTGMLALARYFRKGSHTHDENERTFQDYFRRAKEHIQDSYEKYIENPHSQPWLVINHIRDKIIPEEDRERLAHVWERIKTEIGKQDARLRAELHEIDGKRLDVWKWIKSAASSPKKSKSQTSNDDDVPHETGLTECLKIRNCFRSDDSADDEEIDQVVDGIQARCANIQRIEHIGIHAAFVYLKFSSKEAAAQGYHRLNNWKYEGRPLNVKYIRLNRYYDHFPEAKDAHLED